MLTTSPLAFLPAGRALRRHRAATHHELAAEPAAHLLPGLLSLPLGAGPLPDTAAILALPRSLGVYGERCSGRSLALLQVARHWAETGAPGVVLYIPLAEVDAPNLTPRAVVASAIHKAGLPAALVDGGRPGVLLIDDWELLPADRRAIWRAFLTTTARTWGALRAVVALPAGEPWPELEAAQLPPPGPEQTAAWLRHLLPGHDVEPIVAALRREPLSRMGASLADIALLALIFPLSGIPASRAELYEQAYALAKPLLAETPRVGRAVLRHYRLARGLAGGDDLDTLTNLSPAERAAVAPFAAGLLDDPTPVLAPLWGNGNPDEGNLRALMACAREWPGRAPLWDLRLVERLTAPGRSPESDALLAELGPALPALLAAAGRVAETRALAALEAADNLLPDGPRPWLPLVDDLNAPAALRWAAADLLAARPPAPKALAAPPALADGTTMAARCFIAAATAATRHLLATPALRGGLPALLAAAEAGERRERTARAVVGDPGLPEELRATALAAADDREVVERLAVDASASLRQAALASLGRDEPEEALAAIGRALAHPTARPGAQHEALDAAARLTAPAATGLLARAAIEPTRPLALRLHAVGLLAARGRGGSLVLQRLLGAASLPAALRAAAARHMGETSGAEALPALRDALDSAPPLVRRAAAEALGALGSRTGLREQSAAALVTGLRRVGVDTVLGEQIAHALGRTGAAMALPTLAALLGPELEAAMQAAWARRAPEIAARPAAEWLALSLPDEARFALVDALADGGTMADPPSRLKELAARQAARVAVTAATALGDLAAAPGLRAPALAALRRGLDDPTRTDVVRAALAALDRAGDGAAELAAILNSTSASAPLRWLAVEGLGKSEPARLMLLRRIEDGADDSFLQAAAVRLLGDHGQREALPALRRLARATDAEPHLRRAALGALGQIDDPTAGATLTAIVADGAVAPELRVAAANALPVDLTPAARTALHQTLRAFRQQTEVSVAIARALGRAGDHEALPALMRSAQSDQGAGVVASIEAITALADPTVAPLFVRISQSPTATQGVRLAAVVALLRLSGDEHLPLLNEYLVSASPPLRLQAYAALAALRPDDPRLGDPLADLTAPLALRLQALRHLAGRHPDAPVIGQILTNDDEEPQLRMAAAAALATAETPRAAADLAALLGPRSQEEGLAQPVLRRRCADTLGALARALGPVAEAARHHLTEIVVDPAQTAEHQCWAAECLLRC